MISLSLRALAISTSLFVGSFAVTPIAAAQTLSPEMMKHMPSEAEMRQKLEAAGMTPEQIEEALASIPFPEETTPMGAKPEVPSTDCIDENDNKVCDDEENDPVITECRTSYIDALTKYTMQTYGNDLGDNAIMIAQTCHVAAGVASAYFGYPKDREAYPDEKKAWYQDVEKMVRLSSYWGNIISNYAYVSGHSIRYEDLNITDENVHEVGRELHEAGHLSKDHGSMTINVSSHYPTARRNALRVWAKCENIRKNVRQAFDKRVQDSRVCVSHIPDETVSDDEVMNSPDEESK